MAFLRERQMRAEGVPVALQVLDQLGQIAQQLNLKDRLENH